VNRKAKLREASMPDGTSVELNPTHLSIFVLNGVTGTPITRLPVYAEVVWTDREPPPAPEARFDDYIVQALSYVDDICSGLPGCIARVRSALGAALTATWPRIYAMNWRKTWAAFLNFSPRPSTEPGRAKTSIRLMRCPPTNCKPFWNEPCERYQNTEGCRWNHLVSLPS